MARWYVQHPGAPAVGPVEAAQLRAAWDGRQVPPGTLVCAEGFAQWAPFHSVAELVGAAAPPANLAASVVKHPGASRRVAFGIVGGGLLLVGAGLGFTLLKPRADCEQSCSSAAVKDSGSGAQCVPLCIQYGYDTDVLLCLREARTGFRASTCMMAGTFRHGERTRGHDIGGPVEGGPDDEWPVRSPPTTKGASTSPKVGSGSFLSCMTACARGRSEGQTARDNEHARECNEKCGNDTDCLMGCASGTSTCQLRCAQQYPSALNGL